MTAYRCDPTCSCGCHDTFGQPAVFVRGPEDGLREAAQAVAKRRALIRLQHQAMIRESVLDDVLDALEVALEPALHSTPAAPQPEPLHGDIERLLIGMVRTSYPMDRTQYERGWNEALHAARKAVAALKEPS